MNGEPNQTAGYCPRCEKRLPLCICEHIVPIDSRTKVLILQHPQEPHQDLATARLLELSLPNARLRVGLSWPNLSKAWGEPVENRNWAVLYLGTSKSSKPAASKGQEMAILSARGQRPIEVSDYPTIQGVVALDGTWRQSKALWWRNAWLLKLKRVILNPQKESLYGDLRCEPRRESLSTIEAVGLCLSVLENDLAIQESLRKPMAALLDKFKLTAKPRPIPDL